MRKQDSTLPNITTQLYDPVLFTICLLLHSSPCRALKLSTYHFLYIKSWPSSAMSKGLQLQAQQSTLDSQDSLAMPLPSPSNFVSSPIQLEDLSPVPYLSFLLSDSSKQLRKGQRIFTND